MKALRFIIDFLFGYRWICEHCGDILRSKTRPYCKECCHIHRANVKMFRIK